jgi:hypothetical protein
MTNNACIQPYPGFSLLYTVMMLTEARRFREFALLGCQQCLGTNQD